MAWRDVLHYRAHQATPLARGQGRLIAGWVAAAVLLLVAFHVGFYYGREEPFHTAPPQPADVFVLLVVPPLAMVAALACALWSAVGAMRLAKPVLVRVLVIASLVLPQVPLQHLYLHWMTQYGFELEWYWAAEKLWQMEGWRPDLWDEEL